jgi:hypothetical protein
VKHNVFILKILILFSISFFINPKIYANKNITNCIGFLSAQEPLIDSQLDSSTDLLINSEPATYINSNGELYISEKAFVHGGKPVNTEKFMAPQLVNKNEEPGVKKAYVIIDDFLHEGKYFRAKINLDPMAINSVYVQTMPFPVIPGVMAGHVQARFVMNPGFEIELLNVIDGSVLEKVKDIIVSYEAALPVGGSYNFALGAVNSSPLVGRIVSGQQKYNEGPDRAFNQYKIPISSLESTQLLNFYLLNAAEIQMKNYYNTITRNCTTTIFDGLDTLDRFKKLITSGELTPFLTTIGGDPVIGPAINGLLDRFGDDLVQVQDMKDEYKNIFQSFGVPARIQSEALPFAPGGKNPMTLLVMTTGTENLTPEEKLVVQHMVDDIINDLPETINMLLSSAFSLVEDLQSSPKMIQAMTDVITNKLKSRVTELGDAVPNKPIQIQVQFTPYPSKRQGTNLRSKGIRAQLPFQIQQIDILPENRTEILDNIQSGINDVDAYVAEQIPAFLKNFSVHIQIQKLASKVKSQFLIGLQPTLQNIDIVNNQVTLSKFAVPKAEEHTGSYWSRFIYAINPWADELKPPFVNMLLSHEQNLQDQTANPIASIKFGPEAQINKTGELVIEPVADGKYICWSGSAPHTPQLKGTLNDAPLGEGNWITRLFNRMLKGKPVTFSITELEMNLQELNIKTTKLRIGVLGLRCLDIESVNKQFGDQVNEKLQELLKKVGSAPITIP